MRKKILKKSVTEEVSLRLSLIDQYIQYITENPLKIATAGIFAFGCIFLLIFFLRIGFMPDVNAESIVAVVYAISVFGIFVAIYSAFLTVLPGLCLSHLRGHATFVSSKHILILSFSAAIVCFIFIFLLIYEAQQWIAFSLALVTFFILMGGFFLKNIEAASENKLLRVDIVNSGGIKALHNKELADCVWLLGMWFSMALLLLLPLLFIYYIGLRDYLRNHSDEYTILSFLIILVVLSLANAGIASLKPSKGLVLAYIFGPALVFLVLIFTSNFSVFSVVAIRALGQGEINAARVTVTGRTCNEIYQTLGQAVCTHVPDEAFTAICPVMIRSRIGEQVVLEFAPMTIETKEGISSILWITSNKSSAANGDKKSSQKLIRRVIIDKSKILSWQPLENFGEAPDNMLLTAQPLSVASFTGLSPQSKSGTTHVEGQKLQQQLLTRCGEI